MEGDRSRGQWEVPCQLEGLAVWPQDPFKGHMHSRWPGHRWQTFQAKEMNLQKHLQAQGTQDCQTRHEDLEHLQDHEHQWGQLLPGKRIGG